MTFTGLPCPNCAANLKHDDGRRGATCPRCHREYVISITDATPRYTRLPLHPLIAAILEHEASTPHRLCTKLGVTQMSGAGAAQTARPPAEHNGGARHG